MKKLFMKHVLPIMLCILMLVPNTLASANESDKQTQLQKEYSTYDKCEVEDYNEVLNGSEWQCEYTIEVLNTTTNETSTQEIRSINDLGILTEDYVKENIPSNYKLVKFNVVENEKYKQKYGFFDTLFDIGCLTISVVEFISDPGFWNGFNVVMDGLSVALPFVPSISGVKKMIKASDSLETGLKFGIGRYDDLVKVKRNVSRWKGWEAHHIYEKRLCKYLDLPDTNGMLAIVIPKAKHNKITAMMSKWIPKGIDYSKYTPAYYRERTKRAYQQLYDETGDELYNFLATFVHKSKTKYTSVHSKMNLPE